MFIGPLLEVHHQKSSFMLLTNKLNRTIVKAHRPVNYKYTSTNSTNKDGVSLHLPVTIFLLGLFMNLRKRKYPKSSKSNSISATVREIGFKHYIAKKAKYQEDDFNIKDMVNTLSQSKVSENHSILAKCSTGTLELLRLASYEAHFRLHEQQITPVALLLATLHPTTALYQSSMIQNFLSKQFNSNQDVGLKQAKRILNEAFGLDYYEVLRLAGFSRKKICYFRLIDALAYLLLAFSGPLSFILSILYSFLATTDFFPGKLARLIYGGCLPKPKAISLSDSVQNAILSIPQEEITSLDLIHVILGLGKKWADINGPNSKSDEFLHDSLWFVPATQFKYEMEDLLEGESLTNVPITGSTSLFSGVITDLTLKAKLGELDKCYGRSEEIRELRDVLSRKKKNSAILVGPSGVGKTAIIEGLALELVDQTNLRIWSLNIGALISGTKYRGEFEQRFQSVLNAAERAGNIVLFIDEIHGIIGSGATDGGGQDVGDLLKPRLARGGLQCIGATTDIEYSKYFAKDSALQRRFEPIRVDEPSIEGTQEILRSVSRSLAKYHGVYIPVNIIREVVRLAERYMPGRRFPDKAIDLLDQSCSQAASRAKGIIPVEDNSFLKQAFNKLNPTVTNSLRKKNLDLPVVTTTTIQETLAKMTSIPLASFDKDREKLLNLEETISSKLVGQKQAVQEVAKAVRRARAGLQEPDRPLASFLFAGPSGVGKTELCKLLANEMFPDQPNNLITLDMSEFMEKHSVSKLIGAPPGYIGHDDGGRLTEAVNKNPYSIVLLDEIEKAHVDVFNTLLQILDEGRLTDSRGRCVNFRNTVIIMTSNIGSADIMKIHNDHLLKKLSNSNKNSEENITNTENHIKEKTDLNEILDNDRGSLVESVNETDRTENITPPNSNNVTSISTEELKRRLEISKQKIDKKAFAMKDIRLPRKHVSVFSNQKLSDEIIYKRNYLKSNSKATEDINEKYSTANTKENNIPIKLDTNQSNYRNEISSTEKDSSVYNNTKREFSTEKIDQLKVDSVFNNVNNDNLNIADKTNITNDINDNLIDSGSNKYDKSESEDLKSVLEASLDSSLALHFRPEFLNRIDSIILFNPLGPEELVKVAELQLSAREKLLREQIERAKGSKDDSMKNNTVSLPLLQGPEGWMLGIFHGNEAFLQSILNAGYDPRYGARPMKRAVGKLLIDPLVTALMHSRATLASLEKATFKKDDTKSVVILSFSDQEDFTFDYS